MHGNIILGSNIEIVVIVDLCISRAPKLLNKKNPKNLGLYASTCGKHYLYLVLI